jgi:hypothetical protein
MKTIKYKGWMIEKFTHPKLQGRYSLFDNNDIEVCRSHTIKEAKAIITKSIKKEKTYFTKYGRYYISEIKTNIESCKHFSEISETEKIKSFYLEKSNYFEKFLNKLS